ncbi:MAG: hemolysin family protein [Pseudomonadota bacterium]
MELLIFIVFLTLTISGFCSLFEAVLYSSNEGAIEAAKTKKGQKFVASKFLDLKHNVSKPISGILILNTVANTAGATISGMYAANILGKDKVFIFSIFLTLGILIFSEIIPKTIGAIHWRKLWPFVTIPISTIKTIFAPFIVLTHYLSKAISGKEKIPTITQEEILAAVKMGVSEGEILKKENTIFTNLINLKGTHIDEIMTPRKVIFSLNENLSIYDALEKIGDQRFGRIPIYKNNDENIIGYVRIHDLASTKKIKDKFSILRDISRKIRFVPETMNCLYLLIHFLKTKEHIAIVVNEYGQAVGLVTLEDVIETMLGDEIIDEHDFATDLRKFALKKL